jgi:hypothetical protein
VTINRQEAVVSCDGNPIAFIHQAEPLHQELAMLSLLEAQERKRKQNRLAKRRSRKCTIRSKTRALNILEDIVRSITNRRREEQSFHSNDPKKTSIHVPKLACTRFRPQWKLEADRKAGSKMSVYGSYITSLTATMRVYYPHMTILLRKRLSPEELLQTGKTQLNRGLSPLPARS